MEYQSQHVKRPKWDPPISFLGFLMFVHIPILMGISPEVIILETLPQESGRDRLPVVHARLAWVLSDDAIHHDLFFPRVHKSGLAWKTLQTHLDSTDRSLNQPFLPRNQLLVWQGPGGMRRKAKMPNTRVSTPWADG